MNTTQETDESEYSEDGSSEGEDDTGLQDPSLSLKAQLDKVGTHSTCTSVSSTYN